MKILLCPFNFFHQPIAGGEIYLDRLCTHLLSQGHQIKAIVGSQTPYVHNGIECYPQGAPQDIFKVNNDNCQWADVILTQLIGNAYGYNKSVQHNKPLIFIAHNNSKLYAVRFHKQEMCHVIYNSFQLRDDLFTTFGQFNGTVLHPLLPKFERKNGKSITLVNCNENKGGELFIQIAERLPQYNFIGIKGGYGIQIEKQLPNLTYLNNGCDMNEVYANTRILLVPSAFESFSQCAIEAMSCGIPVIANPTPGIKENLSTAGIFISRDDIENYVSKIISLMGNEAEWQAQSDIVYDRAANVAEKSKQELVKFDHWLNKIA